VVAADAGISRPFVTGQGHKLAGLIELRRDLIQFTPKGVRDLEVIPLMCTDVQERLVPGEPEVLARRVRTNRLFRLPVKITPIAPQAAGPNTQGIAHSKTPSILRPNFYRNVGFGWAPQTADRALEDPGCKLDLRGQPFNQVARL
jgi:hypothetical protein